MKRSTNKRGGAKLGQHLLTNSGIAHAVAVAAKVTEGTLVYEIGPGKGMLTKELLALGARVTAVEKDPAMVAHLLHSFAGDIRNKRLTVIEGDARDHAPDTVFPSEAYVIAANIPYYITGELIRSALTTQNQPRAVALLVQKEVAERIARSKKESILSLSVKAYGTPRYVKTVSRGSFNPPPAVDSAILSIENISRGNFTPSLLKSGGKGSESIEEKFFEVVKAGFSQKRKTLAGNLKRSFGEKALGVLEEAGIPEKARAEDVGLKEWLSLASSL